MGEVAATPGGLHTAETTGRDHLNCHRRTILRPTATGSEDSRGRAANAAVAAAVDYFATAVAPAPGLAAVIVAASCPI